LKAKAVLSREERQEMGMNAKRGVFAGLIAALVGVAVAGFAQVIENPAKPLAKNAGRVITPQEIAVVSDEGTSDFYFKWPSGLAIGPDGSLLLTDVNQVLEFDAAGKFQHNFFKKGQGPGEMPYPGTAVAAGGNVVVFSGGPAKLVYFDRAGRFEKELPLRAEGGSSLKLLHYHSGAFFFVASEFPRTTGDPKVVETPQTIVASREADGRSEALASFTAKAYVIAAPRGGGGMFGIASLIAAPFEVKYLALTHTEEYLLKIYDPAANKVVREFRRTYERAKGLPLSEKEKEGGIFINDKHYTRPERKFENDVRNVLTRSGEIWAVTSTKDKTRGILIDIFNGEGIYKDSFWLDLPDPGLASLWSPGRCVLDGEFLWVVEQSEDGTFSIKKYRIVN